MPNESLSIAELDHYHNQEHKERKFAASEVSKKELEEIVTRRTLE